MRTQVTTIYNHSNEKVTKCYKINEKVLSIRTHDMCIHNICVSNNNNEKKG